MLVEHFFFFWGVGWGEYSDFKSELDTYVMGSAYTSVGFIIFVFYLSRASSDDRVSSLVLCDYYMIPNVLVSVNSQG